MITRIADHNWQVENSAAIERIELQLLANHAGAGIVTHDAARLVDAQAFSPGDQLSIGLPVGRWEFQTSTDGIAFTHVQFLISEPTGRGSGATQLLTFSFDGSPGEFAWQRYTKVSGPPPQTALRMSLDELTDQTAKIAREQSERFEAQAAQIADLTARLAQLERASGVAPEGLTSPR